MMMTDGFWIRVFRRPGGKRDAAADRMLHDLRTETQVVELERHQLRRTRERADRAEFRGFEDVLRELHRRQR